MGNSPRNRSPVDNGWGFFLSGGELSSARSCPRTLVNIPLCSLGHCRTPSWSPGEGPADGPCCSPSGPRSVLDGQRPIRRR